MDLNGDVPSSPASSAASSSSFASPLSPSSSESTLRTSRSLQSPRHLGRFNRLRTTNAYYHRLRAQETANARRDGKARQRSQTSLRRERRPPGNSGFVESLAKSLSPLSEARHLLLSALDHLDAIELTTLALGKRSLVTKSFIRAATDARSSRAAEENAPFVAPCEAAVFLPSADGLRALPSPRKGSSSRARSQSGNASAASLLARGYKADEADPSPVPRSRWYRVSQHISTQLLGVEHAMPLFEDRKRFLACAAAALVHAHRVDLLQLALREQLEASSVLTLAFVAHGELVRRRVGGGKPPISLYDRQRVKRTIESRVWRRGPACGSRVRTFVGNRMNHADCVQRTGRAWSGRIFGYVFAFTPDTILHSEKIQSLFQDKLILDAYLQSCGKHLPYRAVVRSAKVTWGALAASIVDQAYRCYGRRRPERGRYFSASAPAKALPSSRCTSSSRTFATCATSTLPSATLRVAPSCPRSTGRSACTTCPKTRPCHSVRFRAPSADARGDVRRRSSAAERQNQRHDRSRRPAGGGRRWRDRRGGALLELAVAALGRAARGVDPFRGEWKRFRIELLGPNTICFDETACAALERAPRRCRIALLDIGRLRLGSRRIGVVLSNARTSRRRRHRASHHRARQPLLQGGLNRRRRRHEEAHRASTSLSRRRRHPDAAGGSGTSRRRGLRPSRRMHARRARVRVVHIRHSCENFYRTLRKVSFVTDFARSNKNGVVAYHLSKHHSRPPRQNPSQTRTVASGPFAARFTRTIRPTTCTRTCSTFSRRSASRAGPAAERRCVSRVPTRAGSAESPATKGGAPPSKPASSTPSCGSAPARAGSATSRAKFTHCRFASPTASGRARLRSLAQATPQATSQATPQATPQANPAGRGDAHAALVRLVEVGECGVRRVEVLDHGANLLPSNSAIVDQETTRVFYEEAFASIVEREAGTTTLMVVEDGAVCAKKACASTALAVERLTLDRRTRLHRTRICDDGRMVGIQTSPALTAVQRVLWNDDLCRMIDSFVGGYSADPDIPPLGEWFEPGRLPKAGKRGQWRVHPHAADVRRLVSMLEMYKQGVVLTFSDM